jgi:Tfp pilus assembly protein PilP
MRPALTIIVGFLLAAISPGLRAQTKPAAPAPQKPTTQTASKPAATAPAQQKPAASPAAKPATPGTQKPTAQAGKPAGKPAAKTAANKPAKKPAAPTRAAGEKKPADAEASKIARRDPFESLVARQAAAARNAAILPPGKAGLQVATLRVDGIVKASNGMIAVVTNPQSRTYFLREGDRLYDGSVEKISMDGVTFHEEGKDAFGKPVERQVNKRIYSIAGEQQ